MRLAIFALVCMLFSGRIAAQNIIPRFENIGVNDGLSQSSVYSIYQDKKGFMWFGTADGLNRYDGENIRVYKINDKKIANSNFIHGNICEDSSGNIWFCNETGLFYYDPLRDRLTRKITYSQYKWTAGIFIDNKDILYIMNPLTGVNAYDIKLNKLYLTACRFKTPYADFVASGLTTDFKNSIWLKSPDNNGLFFFNTRTNKVKYCKTGFKFRSIFYVNAAKLYFLDNAGRLLITDTAIHVEDKIKYTPLKNKTLSITAISRDDYHRIWISTVDNGLICYDERTNIFTGYLHDNSLQKSLPINMLPVLCIDHSGNLWVGTDGGGVCKLDLKPPRFNLFPLNEGDYPFLKDYFIKCLYEDEMGRIWFGTVNNGLNIYDPVTKQIKNYNYKPGQAGGLPGPMVSCIFKDREGLLWVCTGLGLAVFNERNGTFIPVNFFGAPKLNEHNNFVYKLIELKNGNLLAATFYGLMLIKRAGNI